MAESSQTKKILAQTMKEMMSRQPFAKISVGDLCGACNMNRKSFYYHFRDKYDLVNWIFQTEFLETIQGDLHTSAKSALESLCRYFYENRGFYYHALSVQGQDSFQDYFRVILDPVIRSYALELFDTRGEDEAFFVTFFTDALIVAILRWLSDRNCMKPEKFTALLYRSVEGSARLLQTEAAGDSDNRSI